MAAKAKLVHETPTRSSFKALVKEAKKAVSHADLLPYSQYHWPKQEPAVKKVVLYSFSE